MDKIGPMCRSVEDCALVFNAIYGPDGRDDTVVDAPFMWNPDLPLSKLRDRIRQERVRPAARAAATRGGARQRPGRGRWSAARTGRGLSPRSSSAARGVELFNDALDVYRKAGATLEPIELPATQLATPSASS